VCWRRGWHVLLTIPRETFFEAASYARHHSCCSVIGRDEEQARYLNSCAALFDIVPERTVHPRR